MQNSQSVFETVFSHRSIRKFTNQPIESDTLNQLIYAGQMASTSSYMQNVSVIRVTDSAKRAQIRQVCTQATQGKGHAYVEHCAEFLVFCIDGTRHKYFAPEAQLDWTEVLLVGAVDVGIFAQNVMLAAESIGLGGAYIGSLRNDLSQIAQILNTPDYVVPLVGMCLGYPDQSPEQRPRLPLPTVLFNNEYSSPDATELDKYNQIVKDYYQHRSNLDLSWQQQIQNNLCTQVRPEMLAFLQSKGFAKK